MHFTGGTLLTAFSLLLLTAPGRARADVAWLTLQAHGSCSAHVEQLAQRIEHELAGVRPDALSVTVEIDEGMPVRARVRLLADAQPLGETQVEASSCDQALTAVTSIAALALSAFPLSEPAPAQPAPTTARPAPVAATARAARVEATPFQRDGELHDESRTRRDAVSPRWRVLAAAGVATGAGVRSTLLVVGGLARGLGRGELRLLGRYGVPASDEQIEARHTRVRSDFGAAAVDYCLGLDRARWLSLCAGLELLSKRVQTLEQGREQGHVESTQRNLVFGPSAGLTFVLRDVVAQPQLELAALLPLVGAAPVPGFRAALGGGVPF
jgi:hypothetical protein